jgi:Spy/CpxP family protein refolding chaperone
MAVLALSAAAAMADPPPGPPPGMRGPGIERLTKDLSLNESQQAEVKRIFDAQRTKMDAQRQQFEASGTRPTHEEMRAHHEQADADLHQQLAAVLSAEQLAKFDELRKRQRPGGPPRGEDGGAPPQ